MEDGYDDDAVNVVLGQLSDLAGITLVCIWDYFDDCGVGGNADFYVLAEGESLHLLDPGVWDFLSGSCADLPPIDQWVGEPADDVRMGDLGWADGRHNYARSDTGSPG